MANAHAIVYNKRNVGPYLHVPYSYTRLSYHMVKRLYKSKKKNTHTVQ